MMLLGILIGIFIATIIGIYYKLNSTFTLKINDAIKTLELPIVSLKSNGKIFNFLVDTGSNKSHLKIGVAEMMNSTPLYNPVKDIIITTGNGKVQQFGYYNVIFDISKKIKISQRFEIMDLEDTFLSWGVDFPIHGILGVDFLSTFGYKIDFVSSTLYI